jgi:hypothetical protein
MLAINQISFKNIPITTPEDLIELINSGKLPFDQIPLLEINGSLPEFLSSIRSSGVVIGMFLKLI